LGTLHNLHDRFRDDVEFLVVYVREAHPEDGWVLWENGDAGIAVADPLTAEERRAVAATCTTRLTLRMPVAVDDPDDAVARAYGGWPDRLYLVGRDGRIAFRGGEGPFGFHPEELERAIEEELAR
jgi:hypothetical protein